MTPLSAHLLRAVLATSLCAPLVGLAAEPGAIEEAARVALAEGDHARALSLSRQIAAANPRLGSNWYRMAMAAAGTGDYGTARVALSNAEAVDPKLTFASSPARVERLRNEIHSALPAAPAALQSPPIQLDEAAAATKASLDAIGKNLSDVSAKVDGLNKQVSVAVAQQAASTSATSRERAVWIVGFILVGLVAGAMLAMILERAAKLRRSNDLRDLATLPLHDLIVAGRDTTSTLLQRLQTHGQQNTEIYVALQRLLPIMERESGRASVKVAELTTGIALAGPTHDLAPKPPVLGRTDARTIHQHAVSGALAAQQDISKRLAA